MSNQFENDPRRKTPLSEKIALFRNRKEVPQSPGIAVTAEGTDLLHRWVRLQDTASQNQLLRQSTQLESRLQLGFLSIGDEVLIGMGAGISYSDEKLFYELSNRFMLAPQKHPDKPRQLSRNKNELIEELININGLMFHNNDSLDLLSLTPILAQRQNRQNLPVLFEYKYDEDTNSIEIKPVSSTQADDTERETYSFHGYENTPLEGAYCLHIHGTAQEDEKTFERKYKKLAQATQEIANAIYELNGRSAPQKTYTLRPPENAEELLKRSESTLKTHKRMLAAGGIMDGDDDLAEEILQKIKLEKRPDKTFDDIGGCNAAKEELKAVVDALKNPDAYKEWGTNAPRGVLLYGEPGTGKTSLAKALAREAKASIYVVNVSDIVHALYGRAERSIQVIFDEAEKDAPIVILFDEIDALAGIRQYSSEVTSRIVSVLATNLDGIEERNNGIVVVGATNRLEAIDPALLRPGRFDMLIEVPLPENGQREQIFGIHMTNAEKKAEGRELFNPSLNLAQLITATDGFSGADIEEIIRRALNQKVRQQRETGSKPAPVTTEELLAMIKRYESIRIAKRTTEVGFRPISKR